LKELLAKWTLTKLKELGLVRTKIESNSVTTTVSILHFIKVILDKYGLTKKFLSSSEKIEVSSKKFTS